MDLIENLGKPVIAAVNGFALGGGCEAALACTIRIASENAKFGLPEVKLGIIPGYGGTQRLPRLVGKGVAMQLILSGAMIDAQEAHRVGLVNEVVPAAELIARAEAILNQIGANAPLSIKYAIEAINKGLETSLAEGLASGIVARRHLHVDRGQEGRHVRVSGEAGGELQRTLRNHHEHGSHFCRIESCGSRQFHAGPGAATVLSDFGADVIKVEPPGIGDPQRMTYKFRLCRAPKKTTPGTFPIAISGDWRST